MGKQKTSSPGVVAEPEAAYGRMAPKLPAWRFKRLSPQELMAQARKPMPSLRQRVEANPFAEPAYAGLLHTTVSSLLRTRGVLVPAQAELVLLYGQAMARGVEVFGQYGPLPGRVDALLRFGQPTGIAFRHRVKGDGLVFFLLAMMRTGCRR